MEEEVFTDDSVNLLIPDKRRKTRKRFRVMVEWSDASTIKLISAVKCHECLWKSGVECSNIRQEREAAWQTIAEEFFFDEYTTDQLNAKWANLRIQFNANHTKSKKIGEHKVKWSYFHYMKFITENEESTETQSKSVPKGSIPLGIMCE